MVSNVSMLRPASCSPSCSVMVRSVRLAATMMPSSRTESRPQGARSQRSITGAAARSASSGAGVLVTQVFPDEPDGLLGMTHVRAVPRRLHLPQRAAGEIAMHVLPDLLRRDEIVDALEDERWNAHVAEVGAIVREEGRPREAARDLRIGRAEALGELLRELRAIGILHDLRREVVRPADVVPLHCLQQLIDVIALEAADVFGRIVNVPRRWADEDQSRESLGLAFGGEHRDDRAHGM